jgi:hypothetical protein
MTYLSSDLAGRVRAFIMQWFHSRRHECVHCCQCGGAVTPWDSCCQVCDQKDPARLSASAAMYLVLGFVLAAIVLPFLNFGLLIDGVGRPRKG